MFDLSPQFYLSCLQNAWITTDLLAIFTAAVDYGQLVPKYKSKVNLTQIIWAAGDLQIILFEIIELQENGSRGRYLAWISNFHFYMGIAA